MFRCFDVSMFRCFDFTRCNDVTVFQWYDVTMLVHRGRKTAEATRLLVGEAMAAISQEDAAVIARITEPEALRMASTVAPDGIQETKTGGGGGGGKLVVQW
jgi:hypothetical protein